MPFIIAFLLCALGMGAVGPTIYEHEKTSQRPQVFQPTDNLPLEFVMTSSASPEWSGALADAARLWGQENATWTQNAHPVSTGSGVVSVTFAKVYNPPAVLKYGYTKITAQMSKIMYADIVIDPRTPEDLRVRYIAHEMSHALSFVDSSDPRSVMFDGLLVSGSPSVEQYEVPSNVPSLPTLQDPFSVD
jgi:hypothetical protein